MKKAFLLVFVLVFALFFSPVLSAEEPASLPTVVKNDELSDLSTMTLAKMVADRVISYGFKPTEDEMAKLFELSDPVVKKAEAIGHDPRGTNGKHIYHIFVRETASGQRSVFINSFEMNREPPRSTDDKYIALLNNTCYSQLRVVKKTEFSDLDVNGTLDGVSSYIGLGKYAKGFTEEDLRENLGVEKFADHFRATAVLKGIYFSMDDQFEPRPATREEMKQARDDYRQTLLNILRK